METPSFGKSVNLACSRLLTFKGRSRRSEFWWFYLFIVICVVICEGMAAIFEIDSLSTTASAFNFFLIPVTTRRLHDTGRSGWLQLLSLTIIGFIPLIIWWAQDSDKSENKYGPSPKYQDSSNAGSSNEVYSQAPKYNVLVLSVAIPLVVQSCRRLAPRDS